MADAVARYATSVPWMRLAPLSAVPSTTDTVLINGDTPETVVLPATAGPDLEDRVTAHRAHACRRRVDRLDAR